MVRSPKVLLVYPAFPPSYWGFQYALELVGKRASMPPLGLLTVAAMFPAHYRLRLVDMNVAPLTDADLDWADAGPRGHGGRGGALSPGAIMRTCSLRRTIVLLLLAACLALPWPAAAAPRKAATASHSTFLDRAWSFLQSLWGEAGCIIDPGGRCATGNTQPTTDTGCGIDPGGRCLTGGAAVAQPNPPALDEGCGIDPGGLCRGY